jgi:hypothetical protein
MLNSNQSNRKNIWKFGIILPFVTAFMLLFQIETIAQEKFVEEAKTSTDMSSSISSIITKNLTDKDLDELEKIFSDEHQTLTISNVQRNESNEIIAIKLVFDSGKTYNQVFERKSTTPIDDIKIFANTDKNKEKTCGFLEISTPSEKVNKDEVIEVDGFETNDNPKYFSIDNMTKNGKEVVLIVNGKIKGPTEKMKIPYDEELGEMKEITPAEFEKKYNKNGKSDRYYYEVETVKTKLKSTSNSNNNAENSRYIFINNNGEILLNDNQIFKIIEADEIVFDETPEPNNFLEVNKKYLKNGVTTLFGNVKYSIDGKYFENNSYVGLETKKGKIRDFKKKEFTLLNGDVCVIYDNYRIKIPSVPSIDLSNAINKIYVDGKFISNYKFYSYPHTKLKTVISSLNGITNQYNGNTLYFTTK